MKSLYDFNYDEMCELALAKGFKKFRGHQIFQWLYRKRVESIEQMSDLSKDTRELLQKEFKLSTLTIKDCQTDKDGTRKYLFKVADGSLIESVLMHFDYGKSVCITSQVGCNMGCSFCASGLTKKKRNLTSGEMVSQLLHIQQDLDASQERISHIVVMGSGEPFDNYEEVMHFLGTINHDCGLGIGARHITISTCGIVPQIREFANAQTQYNLAISLHAPNDTLRSHLMQVNKAYPLKELMSALKYYAQLNNRRLTFEYILLKGINDQKIHVEQLANLLKGMNAYVNLIPYNEVKELPFTKVAFNESMKFYDALMKKGIRCTIRKEHGTTIDAACGQLRIKHLKKDCEAIK